MREIKRNISLNFLRNKIKSIGDPLNHVGIMTMNNLIPYKKPIIKQNPIAVNAKDVIREIEDRHNGLRAVNLGDD